MKIANLLHFYQPPYQQADILNRVVHECYKPLIEGFLSCPKVKVVVNITGVLTQMLMENGYEDVIFAMTRLAEQGQLEFTGSAIYHAFLPLLSEDEIVRQVEQNNELNRKYFGNLYAPTGFFSPEMAVNDKVLKIANKVGCEWIAAPEVAHPSGFASPDKFYKDENSDLFVFFRNKRVSVLMLSAIVRDAAGLVEETQDIHDQKYWFTVMDAETFGHHRIGHDKFLFDIMKNDFFEPVTVSELIAAGDLEIESTKIRPSTWTNEEQDFWLDKEHTQKTSDRSFILWRDPENPIHKLQWELVNFALETVNNYKDKSTEQWEKARADLDMALASDQFWWASAKPWWSLEMIEQGAFSVKTVISDVGDEEQLKKADELYRKILDQAFEWQRTGYIRKRHLENSSTFMKKPFKKRTPAEWYNQMVLEFEDEMKSAAEKQEFEKSVKWRDALLKLKQGTDIYDVLHVVDELWNARNIPSVKPFLEHDWQEFSEFVKDHFEDVGNEEAFKKWKQEKLKA
jgi:hypothetical protein